MTKMSHIKPTCVLPFLCFIRVMIVYREESSTTKSPKLIHDHGFD